jgi:hypothetical protein
MASYEYAQERVGGIMSEEVKNATAGIFYKADGTLGTENDLYKNRVPERDADGKLTGRYIRAKYQTRPNLVVERVVPGTEPETPVTPLPDPPNGGASA